MNYQITSDNIQISPSMKNLATEKFEKVERLLTDIPEDSKFVRIVMNKGSDNEGKFTIKIQLNADGKEYFSDDTDYTLETAVVNTIEEIVRMIRKDKNS